MEAPVIKRLPEDVVCKLRGGVVVPSLARCAEELLLNALRARPTRVEVQLLTSCGSMLELRDDGEGIDPADFAALGQRGAGGEALAAMAARYERLTVLSKVSGQETFCKRWERGLEVRCGPAGAPRGGVGTTVRLEDSAAMTKVEEVRRRLWRLALLAPHTALRDEVEVLELPKADATARLRHVLGAGCVLSRLRGSCESCSVEGVISQLGDGHPSDQFMFLYINGRYVDFTPIHKSIAHFFSCGQEDLRGFRDDCWPLFVLNFCCPKEWYDMNFSPDRSVVQFRDWKQPIHFINHCLRKLWFGRSSKRRRLDV